LNAVGHLFGVGHFDPKTGAWQQFDSSSTHGVVSEPPQDIAAAADGSVWVASGSVHSLAFLLPPTADRWRQFDPRDGIPDASQIDHVEVDQAGHVWFGFEDDSPLVRCARNT
jgi:streptogramin lyase